MLMDRSRAITAQRRCDGAFTRQCSPHRKRVNMSLVIDRMILISTSSVDGELMECCLIKRLLLLDNETMSTLGYSRDFAPSLIVNAMSNSVKQSHEIALPLVKGMHTDGV
jgi:hypothetical protein